ncbi:hypothetical protein BDP27DRAFT_1362577 [Rhodocollybia butyracea]|uniref:Uncharacterized protein n=1 Tax=Rhodocollybia butyracea TaxID=206335 RepID=A0A9P5PWD5_9AGAR|nr:hypothetical protein BDP27DRAFT_1362577 [Rhodocollybia butyracea]
MSIIKLHPLVIFILELWYLSFAFVITDGILGLTLFPDKLSFQAAKVFVHVLVAAIYIFFLTKFKRSLVEKSGREEGFKLYPSWVLTSMRPSSTSQVSIREDHDRTVRKLRDKIHEHRSYYKNVEETQAFGKKAVENYEILRGDIIMCVGHLERLKFKFPCVHQADRDMLDKAFEHILKTVPMPDDSSVS